jgi:hypothetical protein
VKTCKQSIDDSRKNFENQPECWIGGQGVDVFFSIIHHSRTPGLRRSRTGAKLKIAFLWVILQLIIGEALAGFARGQGSWAGSGTKSGMSKTG